MSQSRIGFSVVVLCQLINFWLMDRCRNFLNPRKHHSVQMNFSTNCSLLKIRKYHHISYVMTWWISRKIKPTVYVYVPLEATLGILQYLSISKIKNWLQSIFFVIGLSMSISTNVSSTDSGNNCNFHWWLLCTESYTQHVRCWTSV